MDVFRFELADKVSREAVKLYYWGKVIDARTALTMSKASCLPLQCIKGDGPRLFVEGTTSSNLSRSDGCIAWLIPRVPHVTHKKDTKEAAVDVEGADTDMQEKDNDKDKKTAAAAKKKPDPVATHKVEWANVSFTVAGVEYEYALPYQRCEGEELRGFVIE